MPVTKKEASNKTEQELQREDPDFLPAVYNMKKSQLAKLRKEYHIDTMPASLVKDDYGYNIIHKKAMELVKIRTHIDKKRKALTDDARAWTNKVNAEAKTYTEIAVAIEKPWKDKKAELDNAAEIKAEKEREAEQLRVDELEKRVNCIINTTANLIGADSSELRERLNLVNMIIVDESYEEYEDVAIEHKEKAVTSLQSALAEREAFELQQAEIDKGKEELAAAQAEIDRLTQLTKPAPEIKTATDFIPNGAPGYSNTMKRSPESTPQVNSEDVEPYINLTESQQVVAYIQSLIDVESPDVGDDAMVNLVTIITGQLNKLKDFVLTNTQES